MLISLDIIQQSLLSPMVLAFFLGLFAAWVKSDFSLPKGIYEFLSMYLLVALGLKGGGALVTCRFLDVLLPCVTALFLGCILPLIAFSIAKYIGRLNQYDSSALAAHYGSVSVVTFMTSLVFTETMGTPAQGFMTALVAILEVPGIIVGLLLLQKKEELIENLHTMSLFQRIKVILFSKSILLLLGGLFIGFVSGEKGIQKISPFFIDPFQGVLVLFLLDMGLLAGQRLSDVKYLRGFLIAYAIFIPIINACIAIFFSKLINLPLGSAVVFATMASSASYIAAPAVVRVSIPKANPAIYLTASIVITFPFNLVLGIPLYYFLAQLWFNF